MAGDVQRTESEPRRRFLSRRLFVQTLLIVMTIVGVWLGYRICIARQQRAAVEAIVAYGGCTYYDYELDEDGDFAPFGESWAPAFLRHHLGDEFFHPVVEVSFMADEQGLLADYDRNPSKAPLDRLAVLPGVRTLMLMGWQTDDAALVHLAGLHHLEHFAIFEAQGITDADIAQLSSERLKSVTTDNCGVTDRTLKFLAEKPHLEYLHLASPHFTDEGVRHLRQLKKLHSLSLNGEEHRPNEIFDRSLAFVLNCDDFQWLDVRHTQVSEEFVEQVRAKFPNCTVKR